MIEASSGLISNMESYTRNPTAKLAVSWDTILLSGEWFRLDQTELDSGGILTQYDYLENDTIIEGLSDIDSRIYTDETDYLLGLEGYAELQGDSYQYSIADMDVLLDNTDNRYLPRNNKNKLNNHSFEFNKNDWNELLGTDASSFIDEDNPHSGIRDLQIDNPNEIDAGMFSNIVDIYTTDGYNKVPLSVAEDWNLSFYVTGSGVASLNLMAYDLSASGSNDITTGYLSGSAYQISLESDASGVWNRFDTALAVPSGSYYLRALFSISGRWARFDDGQIEKGLEITTIDNDFIGDLILPKRAIRAEVGFNNYNIPKFTGLTNKFTPDILNDTVQVYAYDMADRLKDIIIADKYYENKRTDELIVELASLANIGIEALSLETGTNTVEFAYFEEGSVWTYMNQVAEAEGGRIFFDESGKLTFWNRNHYKNNADIRYTFDFSNNITNLSYEISKSKVKNYIKVEASPKKKLTNVKIYNDTTKPIIESGETVEFFCQYNYKEEISVPALNVSVPVIGTDIIANTKEDGSGSNISSDISISSYYIFRNSMRLNLHNTNASSAYLTTFQIFGDPIVTARYIKEIREDNNSETIYDTQELDIENNLITTDSFASDLATQKLAELKDARDFIKIDAVGVPYLQLGDMVKVQRLFSDKRSVGKTESLFDNFDDNVENYLKWPKSSSYGVGCSRSENNKKVIFTAGNVNTNGGSNYKSNPLNLSGSYIYIEVLSIVGYDWNGAVVLEVELDKDDDSTNYIRFFWYHGGISMQYDVNGTQTEAAWISYNQSLHKWWRIREELGTIYWDTSVNGFDWVNRASVSDPINISSVYVFFGIQQWDTPTDNFIAIFDNFNILPNDENYDNFYIVKNSWSFRDDFMQTLTLEKKVIV